MTFSEWLEGMILDQYGGNANAFCTAARISHSRAVSYISGFSTPTEVTMKKILDIAPKPVPAGVMEDYKARRAVAVDAMADKTINKGTLCWSCRNAVPRLDGSGCSWSRWFRPVTGWRAVPANLNLYHSVSSSWSVIECPEYIDDTNVKSELEIREEKLIEAGLLRKTERQYKTSEARRMWKAKYDEAHREEIRMKQRARHWKKKGLTPDQIVEREKQRRLRESEMRREQRLDKHEKLFLELLKMAQEVDGEGVDKPE